MSQGGTTGPDDDLVAEHVERPGAVVMGHGVFVTGGGRRLCVNLGDQHIEWHKTQVFVHEEPHGKGGATLLVRAAEGAARALGARELILDTRGDLVAARAPYARLGYRLRNQCSAYLVN